MKTILVPTDFSAQAKNAASYAVNIAQIIRAGVILCHAIKVPDEITDGKSGGLAARRL
ncbi:universal stress protein [Mucilaginibacter sp. P25]|uniref:universal stress protein n=1 Tax=unclassified Mucilaginibacter TaxID=2617802 RepID=UPI003D66CF7B